MRTITMLILLLPLLFTAPALYCNDSPDADTDGDKWPDEMERALGTDPENAVKMPNGLADPDRDGLNNMAELEAGTDPTKPDTDGDGLSDFQEVANGNSDPRARDTDLDGSNDFYEAIDGTDPQNPDTDGDGWLDGAEKTAGSDPLDRFSTPKSR
jgi:hypothetical protein